MEAFYFLIPLIFCPTSIIYMLFSSSLSCYLFLSTIYFISFDYLASLSLSGPGTLSKAVFDILYAQLVGERGEEERRGEERRGEERRVGIRWEEKRREQKRRKEKG